MAWRLELGRLWLWVGSCGNTWAPKQISKDWVLYICNHFISFEFLTWCSLDSLLLKPLKVHVTVPVSGFSSAKRWLLKAIRLCCQWRGTQQWWGHVLAVRPGRTRPMWCQQQPPTETAAWCRGPNPPSKKLAQKLRQVIKFSEWGFAEKAAHLTCSSQSVFSKSICLQEKWIAVHWSPVNLMLWSVLWPPPLLLPLASSGFNSVWGYVFASTAGSKGSELGSVSGSPQSWWGSVQVHSTAWACALSAANGSWSL